MPGPSCGPPPAMLSSARLNGYVKPLMGQNTSKGMENGQRHSSAPAATDRAAWRVVSAHCPEMTEKQCRGVIDTWMKNKVLSETEYRDPVKRESRKGLTVL